MIDADERNHEAPSEEAELSACFRQWWSSLMLQPSSEARAKQIFAAGFRAARGEQPLPFKPKPATDYPHGSPCTFLYRSRLHPDGYRCSRRRDEHGHGIDHSFEAAP
jgi:hypothetical protein